jgi:hypothetical protein
METVSEVIIHYLKFIPIRYGVTANIVAFHVISRRLGVRFPVPESFFLYLPFVLNLISLAQMAIPMDHERKRARTKVQLFSWWALATLEHVLF